MLEKENKNSLLEIQATSLIPKRKEKKKKGEDRRLHAP